MTTPVYLAGPYESRDTINGPRYAGALHKIDATCTSTWLTETFDINEGVTGPAAELDDATVSEHALNDLSDVDDCDVFVLITAKYLGVEATASGGRHVETGYALARGKRIIVLGEPENVFHRIASGPVEVVGSMNDVLLAIQRFQIQQLRSAGRDADS